MRFFRKPKVNVTPPEVKALRKQTHQAAKDASEKLSKLNAIMSNGITLKIYLATGGHNDR